MTKLRGNPWAVLLVVSLGFFMTLLDLTIVNIAIPNMLTKLHASLDDILWVINAYALVRPRADSRPADRVPRGSGPGRGHAHAPDADDHHEHLPAGTARRGVRRL